MKPRILLVSLRSGFLDSDRVFPPLGILYLKGCLDENGIYSEIENEFDLGNVSKYAGFSHIAISCVTPQRKEAEAILRKVKEIIPLARVAIGGPHASFYTDECLKLDFDHVVVNDGEKSIIDIVKGSDERVLNSTLSVGEMNALPLPSRDRDFLSQYSYQLDGQETTTIMTSRGCPFDCAFCEHAKTKARYYQVERIRREVEQVVDLGYKTIMFFDDLFAVSQTRVEALCQMIKGFGIKFRCFGHVKRMTLKMAGTLAEAGCVEMGVGLESGSQKILNTVKIPTPTIEESYRYLEICRNAGIRVKPFFVLGLPGETMETIKETEDFIVNSGIDDFDLVIYNPYKGTKIIDRIGDYDISLESGNGIGYYKGKGANTESLVRTTELSARQIKEEKERIFKKYNRKYLSV